MTWILFCGNKLARVGIISSPQVPRNSVNQQVRRKGGLGLNFRVRPSPRRTVSAAMWRE
jgi:hypothetical protein